MTQARAAFGQEGLVAEERLGDGLADPQNLLFRYTDALYRARSLGDVYEAALDAICEGLGCTRASILLFDPAGVMRFVAWRGLSEQYRTAVEGHSPWAPDAVDVQPICVEDIARSSESDAIKETVGREGICGLAFIPLTVHGILSGKFMVYYDVARLFTEREREMALTIARQLGFALEREGAEADARRLAAIVDSSHATIMSKSLDGRITSWNRAAERMFGYRADEILGQPGDMLFPPDRVDTESRLLARVAAGEPVVAYETVRRTKDGRLIDISLTLSPLKDGRGLVIGASKIMRDITEQRRAKERQALLLREMDHRVKNLFALTASLVQLSARTAETPETLALTVVDRLATLSRAHSLTMSGGSLFAGSRQLHALVDAILQPFKDSADAKRIVIEGDDAGLLESQVTPLALLLYELATNAVKHGSLSTPEGRIAIQCRSSDEGVMIDWRERGGPQVNAEINDGFGSKLIAATAMQLGKISHYWEEDGLRVEILVSQG